MAKCKLCGREKEGASSCIDHRIKVKGRFYKPVPYKARNKTIYEIHNKIVKRCPVCNVKEGGLHHVGCTLEVCPCCGRFWLSCNCYGIKVIDKTKYSGADIIAFPLKKRGESCS